MQGASFLRFTKLAIGVWLAALCLVLVFGLLAGRHADGEVAMQMFLLTLPVSIGTGFALNTISYSPTSTYDSLEVFLVWLPFFIAGLAQARIIFLIAKFLANKLLTLQSSGSPSATDDFKR
jgi:hypothetical protein